MDVKRKPGVTVYVAALLISVVPAFLLSLIMSIKGNFLSTATTVIIPALCALGAAAAVIWAARDMQSEEERADAFPHICGSAALYLLIFTALEGLCALANLIITKTVLDTRVMSVPLLVTGVIQAVLLPAFLYRMVSPANKKHLNLFRYLLAALLMLLIGAVFQAEKLFVMISGRTFIYTTIPAAFAARLFKAFITGLLLSAAMRLLANAPREENPDKKKAGLVLPIIFAAAALVLGITVNLLSTPDAYQKVKNDIETVEKKGFQSLKSDAVDMAEYNYSKALNRRDGWLNILDEGDAGAAYEQNRKDLGMTVLHTSHSLDLDRAEHIFRQNFQDIGVNAVLVYLYNYRGEDETEQEKGVYKTEAISFLAANATYIRPFGVLSDLSEKQKEDFRAYLESKELLKPLCDILYYTQDLGRTGEANWRGQVGDVARAYPDDLSIQYYAASYLLHSLDDYNGRTLESFIDRFYELGVKEAGKNEKDLKQILTKTVNLYMGAGIYQKAYDAAEQIKTKNKKEQAQLNLLKLQCLDKLDRDAECAALAKSMLDSGSKEPLAYFYAGVSAVKAGDRMAAVRYFSDICALTKPTMSGDEIYELEQYMLVLAEYICLDDDDYYTDFTYACYDKLTEEERNALKKNALAYNYLEGVYQVFKERNLDRSIEVLDVVTEINPKLALAWYLKGAIYYDMKQFDKAAEMCEKSLAIHDDVPAVMYTLANVYDAQNRREEAYAMTVRVYERFTYSNHEKDWFGVGLHNANMMRALRYQLDQEAKRNGGDQE